MPWRLFSLAALMLTVGVLVADDKKAEMEKMMAVMMKHATPAEGHKILESMAGKWNYTGKMWMDPTASPKALRGTAESKLALDGRFLSEHVKSSDPEFPFEGKGWTGFDNHKQKYVYSWIDSWSTGIMNGDGTFDKSKNTLTTSGECFCPMVNGNMKTREVTEIRADGSILRTFFSNMDGKELKTMELHFTKAK